MKVYVEVEFGHRTDGLSAEDTAKLVKWISDTMMRYVRPEQVSVTADFDDALRRMLRSAEMVVEEVR